MNLIPTKKKNILFDGVLRVYIACGRLCNAYNDKTKKTETRKSHLRIHPGGKNTAE